MCSVFDADEDAVAVGILDVDDRADDPGRDGLADSLALVAADPGNEAQRSVHEADRDPQVHDLASVLGDTDAKLSTRARAGREVLDPVARFLDPSMRSFDAAADTVGESAVSLAALGPGQRIDDRRRLFRAQRAVGDEAQDGLEFLRHRAYPLRRQGDALPRPRRSRRVRAP